MEAVERIVDAAGEDHVFFDGDGSAEILARAGVVIEKFLLLCPAGVGHSEDIGGARIRDAVDFTLISADDCTVAVESDGKTEVVAKAGVGGPQDCRLNPRLVLTLEDVGGAGIWMAGMVVIICADDKGVGVNSGAIAEIIKLGGV